MKFISFAPLALALIACSADNGDVDLGDDQLGSNGQSLEDYEGQWDGYAEAYDFGSGSDRLRFSLDASGNGTVRFGDAAPIAAFSNPQVGYPPSDPFDSQMFSPDYAVPRQGYDYPVHDSGVSSGRIRFAVRGADIVKDFCEAQTTIGETGATPTSYTCSPTGGSYDQTEQGCEDNRVGSSTAGVTSDCGWVKTCLFGCTCDATSCTSRSDLGVMQFDGALTSGGGELVGTLVVSGARVTVRLSKQ